MPIDIDPPVSAISIPGGATLTNDDWETSLPATVGILATALFTQIQALGATTGTLTKAVSGAATLSGPESVNLCFIFTGTLSAAAAITFPAGTRMAVIVNNTSGGFGLTVGLATGTTVSIPASGSATIEIDGTNCRLADGIARTSGGATIPGTLAVSGAATLASTLAVTGNATFAAAATVTGAFNVDGAADFDGALDVAGTTELRDAVTLDDDLTVAGTAAFLGQVGIAGQLGLSADLISTADIVGATLAARSSSLNTWVYHDAPDGNVAMAEFATAATPRWRLGKNSVNNFELAWFDAAGVYQASPMEVTEDTGHVRLLTLPTSSSGLDSGTLWNDSGTVKVA